VHSTCQKLVFQLLWFKRYIYHAARRGGGQLLAGRCCLLQEGANLRPDCEEFVQAGRFGEEKCRVVRAAGIEPVQALRCPQHENRNPGQTGTLPYGLQDPVPGNLRQIQIQQNTVRPVRGRIGGAQDRNAVRPIVGQNNLAIEALSAKSFPEKKNVAFVVVDDDNPVFVFVHTFTHHKQEAKLFGQIFILHDGESLHNAAVKATMLSRCRARI